MDNDNQAHVPKLLTSSLQIISKAAASVRNQSVAQLHKISATNHMQEYFKKAQEFCSNHKEIILVASAAAVTYFFTKKFTQKQIEEKPKIKKSIIAKKTFISD